MPASRLTASPAPEGSAPNRSWTTSRGAIATATPVTPSVAAVTASRVRITRRASFRRDPGHRRDLRRSQAREIRHAHVLRQHDLVARPHHRVGLFAHVGAPVLEPRCLDVPLHVLVCWYTLSSDIREPHHVTPVARIGRA